MEDIQTQIPVEYGGFSSAPQQEPQNVFSMLFPEKQAPQDPYTRLRVKIAKSAAERKERLRKVDEATMPFVQQDIAASQTREMDVSAKINEAMEVLKQPPPVLNQGPNDAELYSAVIGGLMAPGNVDHILESLQKVSGARNQQEFDAKLAQYGMTRDQVMMSLKYLQNEQNYERDLQGEARRRQYDLEDQARKGQTDIDKMMADADLDIAFEEYKDFLARQGEDRKFTRDKEFAEIEAEAKAWADQQKSLEDGVNDLRDEIQRTLQSLGEIGNDDRKVFESRRQALKAAGVPEAKLPHIPKGKTRLQVQYEEGKPREQVDYNNAVLRGKILDKQLNAPPKPSAETVAAGKSFGTAQKAVDKAIRATNVAFANLPPEPTGFMNQALDLKYRTAMSAFEDAVQKEYEAVMQKRQLANPSSPIPSFEDYLQSALKRYRPKSMPVQTQSAPTVKVAGTGGLGNPKKDSTSSLYNAARSEGLALIKKHPDKANAIRKRFFDTYGVPLK